jgi:mannosyltransferase
VKTQAAARIRDDHRGTAVALVLLVGLAGVVRFWDLGAARLNYDESFTAMAGRLPVGSLFDFLRLHDSHPPLDYLLRAPLARAGVSEFWFRAPSAILSLGAVALFAWWMRERGRFGLIATTLMGVSAFEAVHGREARMYAELELLGVAIAVLAAAWLATPRYWHAPTLGVLVFVGLVTHVSMFLLGAGLLALPGRRTEREAWRWRAAIGLGVVAWVVVWGPSFTVQARGGHSSWIPPTTAARLAIAVGHVISFDPALAVAAAIATIAGGVMIWNRDAMLGRVWLACAALPIAIAAVAGRFEPIVLDRTFTLMAWAPCLALACLIDTLASARRVLGVVALVGILVVMVPSTLHKIEMPSGPDRPLRELARDVKPGDIVAVRPASKAPEIAWSLGVREHRTSRQVAVLGVPKAFGIELGNAPASGRVWLLDWRRFRTPAVSAADQCAPRWARGHPHIRCLREGAAEA